MESHDANYERLKSYWVHGLGAAKIAWGAPDDYARCVLELGKYTDPGRVHGQCANLHKDATGLTPAEHAKELGGEHKHPSSAGGIIAARLKGNSK